MTSTTSPMKWRLGRCGASIVFDERWRVRSRIRPWVFSGSFQKSVSSAFAAYSSTGFGAPTAPARMPPSMVISEPVT